MRSMNSARTLVVFAAMAAVQVAPSLARAQSAEQVPKVVLDARLVQASPDGVRALGVNWGVEGASGARFGSVNDAMELVAAFSTMESAGRGKVLATPRLTIANNAEGEIIRGAQVPIQTVANNTVTVSWKDVSLHLKVRPEITSAETLNMHVSVENGAVNLVPFNYTVKVADGSTTVIGGLGLDGTRGMGGEVLIFLTPRIVQ